MDITYGIALAAFIIGFIVGKISGKNVTVVSPNISAMDESIVKNSLPSKELSPEQLHKVAALIKTKNLIPAIKLVREYTGLGLKESKDLVEEMTKKL